MFRQFITLALAVTVFSSCKRETSEPEAAKAATTIDTITSTQDEPVGPEINSAVYKFDDVREVPVKTQDIGADAKLEDLVTAVNKYNGDGKVKLDLVRASQDTVYIKIDDSSYLTQQMGTLGAKAFMSVTTYTLTEKPDIKYVTFDFEEGDHAAPGTYSRKSFPTQ
jgi:hypothetical protein